MKNKIMVITTILMGFAIGIIVKDILQTRHYQKVEALETQGKILILKDFINVREQPTTKSKKIYEVTKNETYQFVESFKEETGVYYWYKIVFSDRRVGWVAAYEDGSWLMEIKKEDK